MRTTIPILKPKSAKLSSKVKYAPKILKKWNVGLGKKTQYCIWTINEVVQPYTWQLNCKG